MQIRIDCEWFGHYKLCAVDELRVPLLRRSFDSESDRIAIFKNGTCVLVDQSTKDIKSQATQILKEHGKVIPGTPSGDFVVTKRGN